MLEKHQNRDHKIDILHEKICCKWTLWWPLWLSKSPLIYGNEQFQHQKEVHWQWDSYRIWNRVWNAPEALRDSRQVREWVLRSECINLTHNEVNIKPLSPSEVIYRYLYRHEDNDLQQGIIHTVRGNSGNNVGDIPVKAKRSNTGGFLPLQVCIFTLNMCWNRGGGVATSYFHGEMLNLGFLSSSRDSHGFKREEKALLQPVWPSGNNWLLVFQSKQIPRVGEVHLSWTSIGAGRTLGQRAAMAWGHSPFG